MPDVDEQVVVTRNEERDRWEARVRGVLAGFAQYRRSDGLIVFTHTEVDPAFEGNGVGGELARRALDDVRADGTRRVRPSCPFISVWIERHPDYQSLVDGPSTGSDG